MIRQQKIRIEDLALHQRHIALLAQWHKSQWRSGGDDREGLMRSRITAGVPGSLLALAGETPTGFVSVIMDNVPSRPDLNPWLASLYVRPEFRGLKIGELLVNAAILRGTECGFRQMYLHTSTAVDYYQRLGWEVVDEVFMHGAVNIILRQSTM